jgi:hypothetical protein
VARSQLVADFVGLMKNQKPCVTGVVDESDGLNDHLTADRLTRFFAVWTHDPDSISEDEFFDVHRHLLICGKCREMGRACESQAAAQGYSKGIQ